MAEQIVCLIRGTAIDGLLENGDDVMLADVRDRSPSPAIDELAAQLTLDDGRLALPSACLMDSSATA
jgi:hypothetical protein